jgi:general nucleoside transport system ATP-binding protein
VTNISQPIHDLAADATHASAEASLVHLSGIVKRFGDLVANDCIDLEIRAGELHALLGENGAGKSTLVKILYGLLQPDAGVIRWKGQAVTLNGPSEARALGIGMVFQHFSLFENLTVADNVAVAMPLSWTLDETARRILDVSQAYGLALDPSRPVRTLSAGERQRIEIVRCLLQEPKLLVLDEPTSVLTPQEAERLFETLRRLAHEGAAILYISHKLDEIRALCSRATVLRAGRVVGQVDPRGMPARDIAALMVGAEIGHVHAGEGIGASAYATQARAVLNIDHLALPAHGTHGTALHDISLSVRAGEIVGIAGIAGNGQSELFAALSGERHGGQAETITVCGTPAGRMGVNARRALGAAFVAEERLGHGAVPGHPLSDNVMLTRHWLERFARYGVMRPREAAKEAADLRTRYDVRGGAGDPHASTLSGGNLQKFVIGREMAREPALLIVDQPTWGVDAAAATLIRQALIDLAARGTAVLIISQDLDEIFAICDRIAVMHSGALSPARPRDGWTRAEIGLAMAGADDSSSSVLSAMPQERVDAV